MRACTADIQPCGWPVVPHKSILSGHHVSSGTRGTPCVISVGVMLTISDLILVPFGAVTHYIEVGNDPPGVPLEMVVTATPSPSVYDAPAPREPNEAAQYTGCPAGKILL